jgi:hypothetical protein
MLAMIRTPKTTGREMMSARLAGFCGAGFAVELGVGVAMGVELKIVFARTGKGSEGRGGCKQAMWRACRTEKDRQLHAEERSVYSEESPRTICHVVLLVHSAIALRTTIDALCVLKAGKAAVGQVFPRHICVELVADRILKRAA